MDRLSEAFGEIIAPLIGGGALGNAGTSGEQFINEGDGPGRIIGGDEIADVLDVRKRRWP